VHDAPDATVVPQVVEPAAIEKSPAFAPSIEVLKPLSAFNPTFLKVTLSGPLDCP
jgi:hypothetical protein